MHPFFQVDQLARTCRKDSDQDLSGLPSWLIIGHSKFISFWVNVTTAKKEKLNWNVTFKIWKAMNSLRGWNRLTWSPNSNCVAIPLLELRKQHATYREGSIGINLILGSDSKTGVAVSRSPGKVDSCLQLVIHLLVDGTTKLSAIISEEKRQIEIYVK